MTEIETLTGLNANGKETRVRITAGKYDFYVSVMTAKSSKPRCFADLEGAYAFAQRVFDC